MTMAVYHGAAGAPTGRRLIHRTFITAASRFGDNEGEHVAIGS